MLSPAEVAHFHTHGFVGPFRIYSDEAMAALRYKGFGRVLAAEIAAPILLANLVQRDNARLSSTSDKCERTRVIP